MKRIRLTSHREQVIQVFRDYFGTWFNAVDIAKKAGINQNDIRPVLKYLVEKKILIEEKIYVNGVPTVKYRYYLDGISQTDGIIKSLNEIHHTLKDILLILEGKEDKKEDILIPTIYDEIARPWRKIGSDLKRVMEISKHEVKNTKK